MSENIITILVVDDDKEIREAIRTLLSKEGYNVVTAADGMEALDALTQHPIRLILLDVMMPKLDGFVELGAFVIEQLAVEHQCAGLVRVFCQNELIGALCVGNPLSIAGGHIFIGLDEIDHGRGILGEGGKRFQPGRPRDLFSRCV